MIIRFFSAFQRPVVLLFNLLPPHHLLLWRQFLAGIPKTSLRTLDTCHRQNKAKHILGQPVIGVVRARRKKRHFDRSFTDNTVSPALGDVVASNRIYLEILSGLKDGDTVYKEVDERANGAAALFSMFNGMGGGSQFNSRTQQNNDNRQNFGNQGGFNRNTGGFGGGMSNMGGMPRR